VSRAQKAPREAHVKVSDLSRHLIQAQEEERKRISRELHDEAGQGLMVLRLFLGMVASESGPEFAGKIQEAMGMLDRTIGDLRRIIARLSPRVLDEMGLLPALRKEARELSRATGMKARLVLPENLDDIDHGVEIAVYRSVQEALNNIAKHANAANFCVYLTREHGMIRLLVEDDGVGFLRNGLPSTRSFGLVGMRERIAALGGSVRIQSRKGRGTKVRVMLPVPDAVPARRKSSRRPKPEQKRSKTVSRKVVHSRVGVAPRSPIKENHRFTNAYQVPSS
jgi:two-component system sensor histidine kinase UhpB